MQKDGINIIVTFDDKTYTAEETIDLQANFFRVLAKLKTESESK